MTREWRKLEIPTYPQRGQPNEDQTRSDAENFSSSPVKLAIRIKPGIGPKNPSLLHLETKNKLGMPLETPSSRWSGTDKAHGQKFPNFYPMMVQNLDIAGKTKKVSQQRKKLLKNVKSGYKVDISWFSRISQNEAKLGMIWQVPSKFLMHLRNAFVPPWPRWGMCKKLDLKILRMKWNRRSSLLVIWSK